MSQPTRTALNSILLGDELGQIKLVQLDPDHHHHPQLDNSPIHRPKGKFYNEHEAEEGSPIKQIQYQSHTVDPNRRRSYRHRIVRILDNCLQQEPAASRAITNIRPISGIHESSLDTTDKPNSLFLITNKIGQIFICDTDAVQDRLKFHTDYEVKLTGKVPQIKRENNLVKVHHEEDSDNLFPPMLSPIYYNMNNKVAVIGAQPINQTNILVIYQNGDIQHVDIGQDILQASLKMKRKAIRMLGLGYNSDARALHWRIDGSSGICYFDSEATSAHLNEDDPLANIVLNSPTHKLAKKSQNLYSKSPCIQSRKYNAQDRLVPTQVINMITSDQSNQNTYKWSSMTSLDLIYRKLALYDLIGSRSFKRLENARHFKVNSFKLNDNRLAVGGSKYILRVYDVQTQKPIFNAKTGMQKNPLACSAKGEQFMVGDIDWLGGNKTTRKSPHMIATCSGMDSIVKVYDIRSPKPVLDIDLTEYTEDRWQIYENQPRGCIFTRICAFGAPYSIAVPSQQIALGSSNGQMHLLDLRFFSKSYRTLGRMAGFCGGLVREIRFVSESFETSKMISCATDRFVRVHRIQTSFTSVVTQKLATKVFLGTRPTCIQPVCDEITQSYLASIVSRCGSDISNVGTYR